MFDKSKDIDEFRRNANKIIDYICNYYNKIEEYPVKSQIKPGDIYKQIPEELPLESIDFDKILDDFDHIIMPGITHWQSPNFYAYFNSNTSFPSLLGEMLVSALSVNVFSWETSPAGTELEQRVMEWLREAIGLPKTFEGVIQDTASISTLVSILTAREKYSNGQINKNGYNKDYKFKVYCSSEAHSSIEKDVRIAGIGADNLEKITLNADFTMNLEDLEKRILKDIKLKNKPLAVISAIGTTGTTAIDNIKKIGEICQKYDIWHHIDAAHLGSALILEENRKWIDGIENCDTFVFNPHKWLFTNFDFSAYFVKDTELLKNTFDILPEYLKIKETNVRNYKDWGIQLGRRFRALKMWFVINSFGLNGLKSKLKQHIELATKFEELIRNDVNFEIIVPRTANLICFRLKPNGIRDIEEINQLNLDLIDKINAEGNIFLSKTKINNMIILRMNIGQTYVMESHILKSYEEIKKKSIELIKK